MLKILAELPKVVPATASLVRFQRKSTDKNPVPESLKVRYVLVPAYTYNVVAEPGDAQEAFAAAIQEAFDGAATSILQDYCMSNLMDEKYPEEIPDEMLTFSAVLEKMLASATGERLKQDQILAWYDGSKTKQDSETRYGKEASGIKKQAALRIKYGSLASNNPGIDAALALKMISYVNPDDANNPVCAAVIKKLERLSKPKVDAEEL